MLSRCEPNAFTSLSPAQFSTCHDGISSSDRTEPSTADAELDGEDCAVCWAAQAQVIFQPCGHLCTCKSCAGPFLAQKLPCPMCRASILHGFGMEP